jgi:hypothetical protein
MEAGRGFVGTSTLRKTSGQSIRSRIATCYATQLPSPSTKS